MAKKTKWSIDIDQATQMLLAEADVAAMRPALAVAPELVIQALTRKRRTVKVAKKKKARKSPTRKARKAAPVKKRKTGTTRKAARKK